MKLVEYYIEGTSPLLQHNPASMSQPTSGLDTKKIPDPAAEAENSTYRVNGPDSQLWQPAISWRQSMINAVKGRRHPKSKRAMTGVLSGAVFHTEEKALLYKPVKTDIPINEYEIFIRPVVIDRKRILRATPRIEHWSTYLVFEYDEEIISADLIDQAFDIAGRTVGVGDWRPQKTGVFGRFTAERIS